MNGIALDSNSTSCNGIMMYRQALKNLAFLLGLALPLCVACGWIIFRLFPPQEQPVAGPEVTLEFLLGGGAFWYLSLLLPFATGGLIHQLLLLLATRLRSTEAARLFCMLTAPVVLLGFAVVWGVSFSVPRWSTLGTMVPPIVLYALLARPLTAGFTARVHHPAV